MMRRKYDKHIFKTVGEIIHDFETKASTESRLMYETLRPTISFLEANRISRLVNVSKVIRNNGISSKTINKMILYLNKSLGKPKLSARQNKKFNASYQNLMFTSFLIDCPDETYMSMKKYISDNDIQADDYLIEQIKQKVQAKLTINAPFFQLNEIQSYNVPEVPNADVYSQSVTIEAAAEQICSNEAPISQLISEDVNDFFDETEDAELADFYFN